VGGQHLTLQNKRWKRKK